MCFQVQLQETPLAKNKASSLELENCRHRDCCYDCDVVSLVSVQVSSHEVMEHR